MESLKRLAPRRVVLIKPSALGDVVHALPVLGALRDRWPRAHIAWVVNRGLRGLLDGHPHLDEVIPFDRSSARLAPAAWPAMQDFARTLRAGRFDLAIDLQGLLRSGLMAWATGAPVRVGLAEAREGAGYLYTHRIAAPAGATHTVERMFAVARALGVDDAARPRFVPAIDATARAWAAAELAGLPRPILAVNLGARWLTKRWPPESFARLARRARCEHRAAVVTLGAPEDRPLVEAFARALGHPPDRDFCGRTTLPQLSALLEQADVLVSNDTGPLHLGCAAGARTVGIYTCTSPSATGPYSERAIAVETRVWCAASRLKACDRMECMSELEPERVWPAVHAQLSAGRRVLPEASEHAA